MHYYSFNIGDYASKTAHLEPLEDLAYRRMLDLYYSREMPLPKDINEIARLIRMRSHTECIEIVLQDFFELQADGWHNNHADAEIAKYQEKSNKAKRSAEARWSKIKTKKPNKSKEIANAKPAHSEHNSKDNANVMRTHSECNANQEPRTNNQEPIIKKNKQKKFTKPELDAVRDYFMQRGHDSPDDIAQRFLDYYTANGWKVGRNPMKDWKAAVRTWMNNRGDTHGNTHSKANTSNGSSTENHWDKLDREIDKKYGASAMRDVGGVAQAYYQHVS